MSCIASIRRHMNGLPFGEMFTTGDLLHLGTRSAIDQAISCLVRVEEIFRVVRGVFTRDRDLEPSDHEVAKIKARRFNKQLVEIFSDVLTKKFGLSQAKSRSYEFAVNGRTSSFVYKHKVIHLKGVANRKVALGETNPGKVLRYCWLQGRDEAPFKWLKSVLLKLGPIDRADLNRCARLAPAWLTDFISDLLPPNRRTNYYGNMRGHSGANSGSQRTFPHIVALTHPMSRTSVGSGTSSSSGTSSASSSYGAQNIAPAITPIVPPVVQKTELSIPASPTLINWLRFLSIFRRVLKDRAYKASPFAKLKDRFLATHAARLLEIEKYVAQDPTCACSTFHCDTSRLLQARARLIEGLE